MTPRTPITGEEVGHTPGPWVVSKRASRRVTNSFGVVICNAILRNAGSAKNGAKVCGAKHVDEAEANARLIAAAPALKDACVAAEDFIATIDSDAARAIYAQLHEALRSAATAARQQEQSHEA